MHEEHEENKCNDIGVGCGNTHRVSYRAVITFFCALCDSVVNIVDLKGIGILPLAKYRPSMDIKADLHIVLSLRDLRALRGAGFSFQFLCVLCGKRFLFYFNKKKARMKRAFFVCRQ